MIEVLGSGGMGVVYRANQLQPRRPVALKVMKVHVQMTQAHRLRFEREAQAAADLVHPNVVTIYEYDVVTGVPFFSMELVEGKSLDQFVSDNNLPMEERLKLVQAVFGAVNYAHQHGIIHRDLKPANILVTASGQPKVMDFGLAKISESPDRHMLETLTLAGEVLGTVPYMAPEQTLGRPEEIDVRTDVYALGVILYQVVTGRLPQEPRGENVLELMRRIREESPEPPSSVNRWVDDNLQTIILKALNKEKERRYQTAAALAADLGHYLADEPIEAKPPSAAYHLRRLVRRYRIALIPIGVAFAIIILIIAGSFVRIRRERNAESLARSEAVQQKEKAEKAQEDAQQKEETIRRNAVRSDSGLAVAEIDLGRDELAIAYLIHALKLDRNYAPAQARLFTLLGQRSWPCLVSSVPGELTGDYRAFSPDGRWVVTVADKVARVWEAATGDPVSEPMRHDAEVRWAAFSPDGQKVLTVAEDNAVRTWEASSGKKPIITIHHQEAVDQAIITPEGRNIVTTSWTKTKKAGSEEYDWSEIAQVWDAATGKAVGEPIGAPGKGYQAMFLSPDGCWVVALSQYEEVLDRRVIRILEVSTGKLTGENMLDQAFKLESLQFTADGRQFLTGTSDKYGGFLTYRKWETATGKPVSQALRTVQGPLSADDLSRDGKLALAIGRNDLLVWDTDTGQTVRRTAMDVGDLYGWPALFSPDGECFAATQNEGTRLLTTTEKSGWNWSAKEAGVTFGESIRSVGEPMRHKANVTRSAFSPDGRRLATSSDEGSTGIWALPVSGPWDLRTVFRCRGHYVLSPDTQSLEPVS